MRLILTAAIFVAGLMFLLMGGNFLLNPVEAGAGFGLTLDNNQGMASIRADMGAFFIVAAACMMVGAWRRNGDLLLPAAGLFGVALLGRIIGLVMDGPWDGFWFPMLVEGVVVILLLTASRVLPHKVT